MNRPFAAISWPFRSVLAVFVAVDLCFIGANVVAFLLKKASLIADVPELLRITHDNALPEDFNYLKWAIIVVALLWLALRDRWFAPLAWAVVFAMILADDSLQVHEILGGELSADMDLPSVALLYGNDLGEMVVFLAMALIVLVLVSTLFSRQGAAARTMSVHYLLVLAGLGFFGVGIDALHQIIAHFADTHPAIGLMPNVLGMIEDGGEMIVASVATALTLAPPTASDAEPAFHRKPQP